MKKYFYYRGTIHHSSAFTESGKYLIERPNTNNSFGSYDDDMYQRYTIAEVKQFDEMWEIIEVGDLISNGSEIVYYVFDVDDKYAFINDKTESIRLSDIKEIYKRSLDGSKFHRVCHLENDEWKTW